MNYVLKINERAFNKGVREVLGFKPIVRFAKTAIKATKDVKKPADKGDAVVRRR